jgi:hypothetical protein
MVFLQVVDGIVYEGDWKRDKPEERGTQRGPDGAKYVGDWVNGLREGNRVLKVEDGMVYEGEWKTDKRKRKGTEKFIHE